MSLSKKQANRKPRRSWRQLTLLCAPRAGLPRSHWTDEGGVSWLPGLGPGTGRGPVLTPQPGAGRLSYSALGVGAAAARLRRRRKGSRKSPALTAKQAGAPASQYAAGTRSADGPHATPPAPPPRAGTQRVGADGGSRGRPSPGARPARGARVLSHGSYLRRPPWAPAPWRGRPGSAACP